MLNDKLVAAFQAILPIDIGVFRNFFMINWRVLIIFLLLSIANTFACNIEEKQENIKPSSSKQHDLPTNFFASLSLNKFDLDRKYPGTNFMTLSPFYEMWQTEREARNTNTYFVYSASEIPIILMFSIYSKFLQDLTGRPLTPIRSLLNTWDSPLDVPSFWKSYAEKQRTVYMFDHDPEIRKHLLSATNSLFDIQLNDVNTGETVLGYYDSNRSNIRLLIGDNAQLYQTTLPEMLTGLSLQEDRAQDYVKELDQFFANKRGWKKGGMMHIGISGQHIDKIAYLSSSYGRPIKLPEGTSLSTYLALFRKGGKRDENEAKQYRNLMSFIRPQLLGGVLQVRLLVSSPYFFDHEITQISFHYDKEDRVCIDTFLHNTIFPMISKDTVGLRKNFSIRDLILRQSNSLCL